jgi:glutamate-1-semialdehyde 2,1-aminomutase
MPNIEMIRLVSSGTEACMSALRVARAFTGRTKILKFEGCYHGHADMLLVKPGSGAATLGLSGSPGVPEETARHTLTARFNDIDQVREVFKSHGDTLAAIILEPIVGNAGFIRPVSGFLEELRSLCDHHGTLLIFDEVMTGFRVARGGCQQLSGIKPDMTVLGKVIGGGLPVGAYGGRREIMQMVAPAGPVYQAGTLSGNPVAVASGIKTLEILSRPGAFETLAARSKQLVTGFKAAAEDAGIPLSVDYEGGMFGFFFSKNPVRNYDDAKGADLDLFKQFFQLMLDEGIYLAPSAFEAGFLSLQHSVGDIEETVAAAKRSFAALAKQRSAKANS